jgi:hypothetical protein
VQLRLNPNKLLCCHTFSPPRFNRQQHPHLLHSKIKLRNPDYAFHSYSNCHATKKKVASTRLVCSRSLLLAPIVYMISQALQELLNFFRVFITISLYEIFLLIDPKYLDPDLARGSRIRHVNLSSVIPFLPEILPWPSGALGFRP